MKRSHLDIPSALLIGFLLTACAEEEVPLDLKQAFDWNLEGLLSTDDNVRRSAFGMYRQNWPDVRQYVADLVDRPEVSERMAGAYLVAQLGTKEDLRLIRRFLDDASFNVRRMAMGGVVRLKDTASVPALVKFLGEAKYEEVRLILRTLNLVDPEAGEDACAQRAADERWAHRRAAAEALGMLDSQSSASLLEGLLEDPVWLVQMDAAEAVGRRRHQGGHSGLRKLLASHQSGVRAAVARALGSLGRANDLDTLRKLAFADREKKVRIAAVEGVSGFPQDQAIRVIKEVLQEKTLHVDVHKAAFHALLRMGAGKPTDLLSEILQGDDERLANLARTVLQEEAPFKRRTPAQPDK